MECTLHCYYFKTNQKDIFFYYFFIFHFYIYLVDKQNSGLSDFAEDPFKDYRYEDPFSIQDPFADNPGN